MGDTQVGWGHCATMAPSACSRRGSATGLDAPGLSPDQHSSEAARAPPGFGSRWLQEACLPSIHKWVRATNGHACRVAKVAALQERNMKEARFGVFKRPEVGLYRSCCLQAPAHHELVHQEA